LVSGAAPPHQRERPIAPKPAAQAKGKGREVEVAPAGEKEVAVGVDVAARMDAADDVASPSGSGSGRSYS
jgi:hypothetical protein